MLRLQVAPDQLSLEVSLNGAGDPFQLERTEMAVALAPQDLSADGRLLVDFFEGDPDLSIRGDEAEEAWRIIEPILDGEARVRRQTPTVSGHPQPTNRACTVHPACPPGPGT